MSCTPQGTTTPILGLCKPQQGETSWASAANSNWDILDGLLSNNFQAGSSITLSVASGVLTITSTAGGTVVRSSLAGFTLSNDANTPNTFLDIAAGQAADSTNATYISGAAFTKNTTTFTVGSGKGGLCPGLTLTPSTWFHVFAAVVSSSYDVFLDSSVSAANKPGGTTSFRRIGSILTSSAASPNTAVMSFNQDGDYFRWNNPVLDVNASNPGTSAVLASLTVPTSVNVQVLMNAFYQSFTDTTFDYLYISDPSSLDLVPSPSATPLSTLNANNTSQAASQLVIRSNTSGQVRYRLSLSDGNTNVRIATLGWFDRRGRDT